MSNTIPKYKIKSKVSYFGLIMFKVVSIVSK